MPEHHVSSLFDPDDETQNAVENTSGSEHATKMSTDLRVRPINNISNHTFTLTYCVNVLGLKI